MSRHVEYCASWQPRIPDDIRLANPAPTTRVALQATSKWASSVTESIPVIMTPRTCTSLSIESANSTPQMVIPDTVFARILEE